MPSNIVFGIDFILYYGSMEGHFFEKVSEPNGVKILAGFVNLKTLYAFSKMTCILQDYSKKDNHHRAAA